MATISRLAVLLLLWQLTRAEYILCSGYVNTLSTETTIRPDLSKIKITMYRDGIPKDTTTCNPDGSFVISVDESQSTPFSLEVKAPADATFESLVQVIDPKENLTLCDAGINFVFLGFTISAQVLGKHSNIGPENFPVELALADGSVIKAVRTGKDGHYKFANVYPGNYIIKAAATRDFAVEKDSQAFNCRIDWASTDECASNVIVVSGYFIKGTIGKHLTGVVLALYSKAKKVADELITAKAKELSSQLPHFSDYHLLSAKEIREPVLCLKED